MRRSRIYARVEALWRKALGDDHPNIAMVLNNSGKALEGLGRWREAADRHRAALALREKLLGRDHPEVALSLYNIAGCLFEAGRAGAATALGTRARDPAAARQGPPGYSSRNARALGRSEQTRTLVAPAEVARRCPDENTVLAFVERRLPADGASSLEAHVDGCHECRALLAVFARSPESTADAAPRRHHTDARRRSGRADVAPTRSPRERADAARAWRRLQRADACRARRRLQRADAARTRRRRQRTDAARAQCRRRSRAA